ncbi:hypothetical protein [Flavobacterium sp. MK4S-17]|uniref:hypothetical protein n=1 Tax=Flavobacterium sp. MK4S-17 TaxID=2543737 RepID=UPI001359E2F8|nr:hypothetical protein [Flavobacterium sp. MK4S-17]
MKKFKLEEEEKIKTGFKTPVDYFDSLEERLLQLHVNNKRVKVIPLHQKKTLWISAIASVFIIALGISIFMRTEAVALPDDAAIESYLVDKANLNSYDIIQNLDSDDVEELQQSLAISNEAIEDYFIKEGNYEYYFNN